MIRIAIQNKGRLYTETLKFLRSIGLEFKDNGRNLLSKCKNTDTELLYVRNSDIPAYVNEAIADFGITGENVLIEQNSKLKIVKKLGFGRCKLVIAVPKKSEIKCTKDLVGERIATSYPETLKIFLRENNIKASIIKISGSTEIAPLLNLADAICDITQTGTTLQENGLKVITEILQSQAVIIKCPFVSRARWADFEKSLTKEL